MAFFDKTFTVRLITPHLNAINKALDADGGEKYENMSHYIRVAIIQKLRRDGFINAEPLKYNSIDLKKTELTKPETIPETNKSGVIRDGTKII